MIIWINGAFGAGKTETAIELHRRIPNSFLYDPENAGFFIRENVPLEASLGDFQDYPMWRECNYSMLKYISCKYEGMVIVPMTLVNPHYFEEIIGKLRDEGITVHHITLYASKKTIERRLQGRGEVDNSWPAQQIDRCIEGLANDVFQPHINTEKMSTKAVAEYIASMLKLPLRSYDKD